MAKLITTHAQEESTFIIKIEFKDEDGASLIPTAVNWTLTDSSGNIMNSRHNVSETPAATVNIVLQGDDLALTGTDKKRVVLVSATYNSYYGTALPYNEEVHFYIDDLTHVS